MLSYRHAFHAGNHADVLKHSVLLSCLDYLRKKDTALLYVDTHAGAGAYVLNEGYAAQNCEWAAGFDRLQNQTDSTNSHIMEDYMAILPIRRYLEAVQTFSRSAPQGRLYPGSPVLAATGQRPQDHAVLCELHPADYRMLAERFTDKPGTSVHKSDGFAVLRSILPPPSRRALILSDPSYELAEDYQAMVSALKDGLRRFATACWLIWYPLLERQEARLLPQQLCQVCAAIKPSARPYLQAELQIRERIAGERGMYGSGVFVVNPPWSLYEELNQALPVLASVMAEKTIQANNQCWLLKTSQ